MTSQAANRREGGVCHVFNKNKKGGNDSKNDNTK
jgi:hypothetical protein